MHRKMWPFFGSEVFFLEGERLFFTESKNWVRTLSVLGTKEEQEFIISEMQMFS